MIILPIYLMSSAKSPLPTCTVKVKKSVHTVNWSVENFSQICPEDATDFPPVFSGKFGASEKNGRQLMWHSFTEGKRGHLKCFLRLLPSNWKTDISHVDEDDDQNIETDENDEVEDPETDDSKIVRCSFKIWLGSRDKDLVFQVNKTYKVHNFTETISYWGRDYFIAISDLYGRRDELLQDDTLRVTIQMTVYPDNKPVFVDHLSHYLSGSFLSEKFSDVKLKCKGETFDCHKIILAARSSVFQAMFDSGLQEAVKGQVDIEDMKPAALKAMLKFIYTGTMETPEDCELSDLIYGAEKYDLKGLKQFCFEKMWEKATNDDIGSLFVTADTYNAKPEFKETLRLHYRKNMAALMDNANFRDIFVKNTGLFYPPDNNTTNN